MDNVYDPGSRLGEPRCCGVGLVSGGGGGTGGLEVCTYEAVCFRFEGGGVGGGGGGGAAGDAAGVTAGDDGPPPKAFLAACIARV